MEVIDELGLAVEAAVDHPDQLHQLEVDGVGIEARLLVLGLVIYVDLDLLWLEREGLAGTRLEG